MSEEKKPGHNPPPTDGQKPSSAAPVVAPPKDGQDDTLRREVEFLRRLFIKYRNIIGDYEGIDFINESMNEVADDDWDEIAKRLGVER